MKYTHRYPWLWVVVVASLVVFAIIVMGNMARAHHNGPCAEDEIKVRYQVPGEFHCKNAQAYVYEQVCHNKPAYSGVTVTRRACYRNDL